MNEKSHGLLEVLQNQLDIYRKLLSLAQEKEPILIKGNISDLERITKEEERLILLVGRLEEQRQVFHSALADHFELSMEQLTLSELIKRISAEESAAFQQIFEEMTGVLKKLAEVNQNNSELIKNSLKYINFSMDLLTNTDSTPVYNEQDKDKKQSLAKIFDRKI